MASPVPSPFFPFRYQSQDIPFSRWVSLLTLALAPLFAHIIAGAPRAFYLCKRQPKWHERLVHYNPTSVLWRYAAIADRRIRARNWNRIDIAAANALFWTSDGWDGSEAMVDRSLLYCTHLPNHSRVAMLSSDMIKTLIVTLQGAQTLVILSLALGGGGPSETFVVNMAVDFVFYPLAFLGLLRLTSALWLTDDFNYSMRHSSELVQYPTDGEAIRRNSVDNLLEPFTPLELPGNRYRSTSLWSSKAFRWIYLVPLVGVLAIAILFIALAFLADLRIRPNITTTAFVVAISYMIFLTATIGICGFYFAKGSTSTVLPCITKTWYKVYTLAIMAMALGVVVIACIETRETPCGRFTSASGDRGDFYACYQSNRDVLPINGDPDYPFGLAATFTSKSLGNRTLEPDQFWLYNFTGTCLGNLKLPVRRAENLGIVVDIQA